jgi:hypothetical protein
MTEVGSEATPSHRRSGSRPRLRGARLGARQLEQRVGGIDAHGLGAGLREREREQPGPARDVERALARRRARELRKPAVARGVARLAHPRVDLGLPRELLADACDVIAGAVGHRPTLRETRAA